MLDPWANAEPPPLPKLAPSTPQVTESSSNTESFDDDDEVVTSVKELQPKKRQPAPPPLPAVPPPPPPVEVAPPPPSPAVVQPAPITEIQGAVSFEPSLPVVQAFAPEPEPPPTPPPPPPVVVIPSPEPTLVSAGLAPKEVAPPVEELPSTPRPTGDEAAPTPEPPATSALAAELESIEAFADLPDDARLDLARAGKVQSLVKEEEVTGFSLAIILDGEVDVAAMIVDIAAERLSKGRVLKPMGSLRESVPLRLICATPTARVVTWEATDIEATFKACPWVEDDLRAHADRVLALVGVTMGPLADRLDESIRTQITSRLTVREIPEGDELVQKGAPVRELVIVGQGVIELIDDGVAVGSVGTGEIVFGSEVVGGGKATATARAGKGGALVLAVDRGVAQELIVTLPPLLELLAGM